MAQNNLFTKISNLFRKRNQTGQGVQDQQLLIFSEGASYWYTFKPVLEELIKREMPFGYVTLDKNDPALQIKNENMYSSCLGSGAWAYAKVKMLRAKVMLSSTPNIGNKSFPINRPPRVECLAHIFHSVSDLSYYHKGSLDCYDAVLMVGDFALESVRITEKKRGLKAKDCVAVGLPYLDVLNSMADHNKASGDQSRPVLLVAPSWGEKGFLSIYGYEFIEQLAEAGCTIIFRPHPQSMISEKDLLSALQNKLQAYGNVRFDFDADGGPSMAAADVLISDTSSIRFDFAFIYERPVISLAIPEQNMEMYERSDIGTAWDVDMGKYLGTVLYPADKSQLAKKILAALSDFSNFKQQDIAIVRERYISNFGHSGVAIVDWVNNALSVTSF
jgi:hypothetical protein